MHAIRPAQWRALGEERSSYMGNESEEQRCERRNKMLQSVCWAAVLSLSYLTMDTV